MMTKAGWAAVAATMALGGMLAWAAPRQRMQMSPEQRAQAQVARVDKAVGGLTADQKTKMEAIYVKAFNDMAAARGNGDFQSMRGIMTKANDDAKAMLSPDQQAKFPAMMGRGRRGGGGGGF
jgi:hypothetical protein